MKKLLLSFLFLPGLVVGQQLQQAFKNLPVITTIHGTDLVMLDQIGTFPIPTTLTPTPGIATVSQLATFIGSGGGSGSVTSVGAISAGSLTITGSPITTAGTLTIDLHTIPAGNILCNSSGGVATPAACGVLPAAAMPALVGDVTNTAGSLTTTVLKINGTSVPVNAAADQTVVTTASATGSWAILPACLDSSGNHLNYNTSTHAFSCGSTSSGGLAPIANQTVLGNGSGGTAAPVALTLGNNLIATATGLVTSQPINPQTGVTYTVLTTDAGKLITFSNAAATAVTLPQATTAGFTAGFSFDVQNLGAGAVTITPTTSLINAAATLAVQQNQSCTITSDGTNYQISACTAGNLTLGFGATGALNWLGTGAATFNGQLVALAPVVGPNVLVNGTTPSGTGFYRPSNAPATLGVSIGGAANATWTSTLLTTNAGIASAGTTFTLSSGTGGCATSGTLVGGAVAGKFNCTSAVGASTIIINLPTAVNGWVCNGSDLTDGLVLAQTASAAASCTVKVTTATNPATLTFSAIGY